MENIRLTNGTECFTCTVTATDEQGAAELMDNNGAKYYRDDHNDGWTSDAAEESVTAIEEGETDEQAKERLLLEYGEMLIKWSDEWYELRYAYISLCRACRFCEADAVLECLAQAVEVK